MTSLSLSGVAVGYDQRPVLRGVDLEVEPGSTCAVLGPSGCGKTTLLRAIAGFVTPTQGSILLGDRVIVGPGQWTPPEQRGIGLVPQEGALFPHLDVAGNVGFGLSRRRRPSRLEAARSEEVLELVGLAGLGRRTVHELSGGQQQRVALARALAPRPSIVLLDEPFNALDASLRDSLREEVRAALDAAGATAILVTHDQDEALSFASTVAVLLEGRLAMQGTPEQVYAAPADLDVARFVGQVVVWPAQARGGWVDTPLGTLAARTPSGSPAEGRGQVMMRPEQITVAASDLATPAAAPAAGPGLGSAAAAGPGLGSAAAAGPDLGSAAAPTAARGLIPPSDPLRVADSRPAASPDPRSRDEGTRAVMAEVVETTYFGHDWLAIVRLPSGQEFQARGHGPVASGWVRVGVEGEGVFYPDSP